MKTLSTTEKQYMQELVDLFNWSGKKLEDFCIEHDESEPDDNDEVHELWGAYHEHTFTGIWGTTESEVAEKLRRQLKPLHEILEEVKVTRERAGGSIHYIYTWHACPARIQAQTSSALRSKKRLDPTAILRWISFLETNF